MSAKYTTSDKFLTASLAMITGEEPTAVAAKTEQRTRYSVIVSVHPTDDLEYVLHHHLLIRRMGKSVEEPRAGTGWISTSITGFTKK